MIYVNKLGMHFGQQVLFENVSFQLNKGNRYGLVGANGSGKSTLLKILSGEMQAEAGEISFPSALKFGILKQDHFAFDNMSILDVVLMGQPDLWQALQKKKQLIDSGDLSEKTGRRLADLEMEICDRGGYNAESDASMLLAGLGIELSKQNNPLHTLSGGYKLRVLLAQCLFSDPDFLLLDEPTNHLDLMSIIWLEGYLRSFKGTCLIISHDQTFLDHISTHIMDIDFEMIKIYTGSYRQFVDAKAQDTLFKEKEIRQQEKKKEELQQFITRFKAKATKARQANSKSKQLDRMEEIVIRRSSRISPNFVFNLNRPSGKTVVEIKALSKSFDQTNVLRNITLKIERGEKIAVIGVNGIGKSTLLKLITDYLKPSSGSIELGHEVQIGYCPQDHQELIPKGSTPYEWLYAVAPGETIGTIRGLLGRVLIQGDDVKKATETLSGGESARLIFAKIMLQKPNLLLLDEPTNHMDIESLEALSQALQKYQGSIICVSHDRRFIEQFATSILELKPDGHDLFKGSYQEFLEYKGIDYLDRTSVSLEQKKQKSANKNELLQNKEWREVSKKVTKLTKQITGLEQQISTLEQQIQASELRLAEATIYLEKNKRELESELTKKFELDRQLESSLSQWEGLNREKESLQAQLVN